MLMEHSYRHGYWNRGKSTWRNQSYYFHVTNIINYRRHYWPFWPPSGHFGGHIISMEHSYRHGYRNRGKSTWWIHSYYFYAINRTVDGTIDLFWPPTCHKNGLITNADVNIISKVKIFLIEWWIFYRLFFNFRFTKNVSFLCPDELD